MLFRSRPDLAYQGFIVNRDKRGGLTVAAGWGGHTGFHDGSQIPAGNRDRFVIAPIAGAAEDGA